MMRLLGNMLVALGVGALALACQSIAGIERRSLGPCGEYCDTTMRACQGTSAAYSSYATCMSVCQLLPAGDVLEPESSNSVACRLNEARAALIGEPDVHCLRAGPTGYDKCGEVSTGISIGCQSYCTLYERACGSAWYRYGTPEECGRRCLALADRGAFDAVHDHDGDTLQCRLVHVSASAVDPETHCEHAAMAPPVAPCTNPPDDPPACQQYCHVVGIACRDTNAQYETATDNDAQCLAACASLPPGANEDTSINTVGCRLYHAYNAVLDPETHCPHAGPTGDGHCGTVNGGDNSICEAYCRIVAAACPDDSLAAFQAATCVSVCSSLPDAQRNSGYAIAAGQAGGNTLSCRMLNAVRAAAGDTAACSAALGSAPCL